MKQDSELPQMKNHYKNIKMLRVWYIKLSQILKTSRRRIYKLDTQIRMQVDLKMQLFKGKHKKRL